MQFIPQMNDGQNIFVFGSNENGFHHGGAARVAVESWGAVWKKGRGRTGQAYAIPTLDVDMRQRSLDGIQADVTDFLNYARQYPELTFLVTAIGCGIAGFAHEQIAPLFRGAPANCVLPDEWKEFCYEPVKHH